MRLRAVSDPVRQALCTPPQPREKISSGACGDESSETPAQKQRRATPVAALKSDARDPQSQPRVVVFVAGVPKLQAASTALYAPASKTPAFATARRFQQRAVLPGHARSAIPRYVPGCA